MSGNRRALLTAALVSALAATVVPASHEARLGAVALARVSDDSFVAYAEPEVAADPRHPGRLLAAAQAVPASAPDGSRRQLVTSYSTDGGHVWHFSGPLPQSTPDRIGLDVTSAFDASGNAYVLGEEQRPTGGAPLLLWRSRDGGRTFGRPTLVAGSATGRVCCDHGWLRVDPAGTLHVAYSGADNDVLVVRSGDRGRTWSRPAVVGNGEAPVVAAGRRGLVAVAWVGSGTVDVRISHDGGRTFGVDRPLRADAAGALPALAVDNRTGRLYLAAGRAGRIVEWTSPDGSRWSGGTAVASPTSAAQPQLAVGADGRVWTFLFAGRSAIAPYLAVARAGLRGGAGTARRLTGAFPYSVGFGRSKTNPGGFVGDYQGLAVDGTSAVAVWNNGRSGHLQLTSARTG
jgi:hypothetical protein